jgi:hypothetical protein
LKDSLINQLTPCLILGAQLEGQREGGVASRQISRSGFVLRLDDER